MTQIQLDDIPVARVRAAVEALLGHPLNDVVSVHIEIGAITAVVMARDENGQRFVIGKGKDAVLAQNELVRKVVLS